MSMWTSEGRVSYGSIRTRDQASIFQHDSWTVGAMTFMMFAVLYPFHKWPLSSPPQLLKSVSDG